MLSSCLSEANEGSRYSIFNAIFGGSPEGYKIILLTKLVSMALSLGVGPVLDCAALWMQVKSYSIVRGGESSWLFFNTFYTVETVTSMFSLTDFDILNRNSRQVKQLTNYLPS